MQITVKKYIRQKALGINGLIQDDIDPRIRDERLTFINDIDEVLKDKLREYNVLYGGDSDEILNFYTRANAIDYNTDPLMNRNKKSYFWAVSATEDDIKRTHSGQPRNIVDTEVNIVGIPKISGIEGVNKKLTKILEDNDFYDQLIQEARPFTLVEGWGAWKINWDSDFRDTPILLYYRADAVDFIYRSNQLMAIIYRDYFQDEDGKNYILFETRRLSKQRDSITGITSPCLVIEKELFRMNGDSNVLTPVDLKDLPQLRDVTPKYVISNFNRFLGYPCRYFKDNNGDLPGRSIFTGKTDLFDDLDQCLSQAANTVRRSTATEVWDTNYLEKDDDTGLPIMPHSFDRKYVQFRGAMTGDGTNASTPVQVTQPNLDIGQYSVEATNILLQIISGIMSPATLGIDIAKKDNAEAQREKEKVTIFTRNTIIHQEERCLKMICQDLLCAEELMRTGRLTNKEYDITVKYDEFADSSWEAKLETVLTAWQGGIMSDKMAIDTLYKDTLSKEDKDREIRFLENQRKQEMSPMGGLNPEDLGEFGKLGAENTYNDSHEKADVDEQNLGEGV